jgi:cell division protein FtsB
MFDFHEKRKIRRIVYSKFFISGVFIVAAFICMSTYERYTIEREMALKLHDRVVEFESLKMRASSLEADVEHLRNERGIEEELRSRFNVIKEGEQVVVIIDDEKEKNEESSKETPETENEEKQSFFERLKFWLP